MWWHGLWCSPALWQCVLKSFKRAFNTTHASHTQNYTESPFVILTNDFSLKYTTGQTVTELLPQTRHINSLIYIALLHLHRAGWHCPETFQSHQNKQYTCSEKQTFGSHLGMASYAGNSALKFRTRIIWGEKKTTTKSKNHTCFQDLISFSQGRFESCL